MVKIDEDTHKALLLFNRRAEAAEVAASEGKRLTKAVKAKDDAARDLKKVQDSGADQEAINEAEAAYRSALKSWQDIRDGVEPEPVEEEPAVEAEPVEEEPAAGTEPAVEAEPAEEEPAAEAEAEPTEEEPIKQGDVLIQLVEEDGKNVPYLSTADYKEPVEEERSTENE